MDPSNNKNHDFLEIRMQKERQLEAIVFHKDLLSRVDQSNGKGWQGQ